MDDNKKPYRPLLPRLLLALIAVLITIGAVKLAGRFTPDRDRFSAADNIASLKRTATCRVQAQETAWESSFTERGSKAFGGPRRIRAKGHTHCAVSDCISAVPHHRADDGGLQTVGKSNSPYPHILIVGGSVAWGAGASDIANAYFSQLYGMLKNEYPDTRISVLAAYGSTSNTDLSSFVRTGLDAKPDVVVFINGLNDLTVKGQLRHSDASDYILNMKTAARIAERNGIPAIIVRQPFPGGKEFKTDLEKRIMELSNEDYEKVITPLYKHIGKMLEEMAKAGESYYIDAADCFGDETATTFNDQWHFSDPGHKLLAGRIHAGLVPILSEILGNNGDNPD
jgi:lysophospholipase L1-like esterase